MNNSVRLWFQNKEGTYLSSIPLTSFIPIVGDTVKLETMNSSYRVTDRHWTGNDKDGFVLCVLTCEKVGEFQ